MGMDGPLSRTETNGRHSPVSSEYHCVAIVDWQPIGRTLPPFLLKEVRVLGERLTAKCSLATKPS